MNHILQRDENELVKKVFIAQRNVPVQGDFLKLVKTRQEVLTLAGWPLF